MPSWLPCRNDGIRAEAVSSIRYHELRTTTSINPKPALSDSLHSMSGRNLRITLDG